MARVGGVTVKWYGNTVIAKVEQMLENRLDRAAEYVKTKTQQNLLRRRYPPTRSKPGQIPHWETTKLARSIFWQRKGKLGRIVGVPAIRTDKGLVSYGLFLELGTRKMAKRPFLGPTLRQCENRIRSIILKGR